MASSMTGLRARQLCNLCHNISLSRISTSGFQSRAQGTKLPTERLVIPKRRKRDDLAVLRALAGTVGKDPTASYGYHDDPFLLPKSPLERRKYLLSGDSGRKAAKLVINAKPDLFLAYQHDEPKIEAFYPPSQTYVFTEPSEDAIMERLDVLDLIGAAEIHNQLIESGNAPSMDVSNHLLEVLCFYNSESPVTVMDIEPPPPREALEAGETTQEEEAPEEEVEESSPAPEPMRGRHRETWKAGEENAAQIIFDSLEEPDSRSYNAMIRGMVKYGAHSKAFNLFNTMQERGIQTTLEGYNALISIVISIRPDYSERWNVLQQLLRQMRAENVQPNITTFNNLLNSLRLMGGIGRKRALQTLSEMRAVNVEPSLGTYNHLLNIFYRDNLPPTDIIYEILDAIEGQEFELQEPNDIHFFKNAMNVCFKLKDVRLAYRLDALLNTGDNYKLSGDHVKRSLYYSWFLNLVCLMDNSDAMFEYYEKLVPGGFIPNGLVFMEMMRSVQTAGKLEKLSYIWDEMCLYGLRYWQQPKELLLQIMATADSVDTTVLEEFGRVANDIQKAYVESSRRRVPSRWTNISLPHVATIHIRAGDKDSAWSTLKVFRKQKLTPGQAVLEDFISLCLRTNDVDGAMECLELAVNDTLAFAPSLAQKIKQHEGLTTGQSNQLSQILEGDEDVAVKDG